MTTYLLFVNETVITDHIKIQYNNILMKNMYLIPKIVLKSILIMLDLDSKIFVYIFRIDSSIQNVIVDQIIYVLDSLLILLFFFYIFTWYVGFS